MVTVLLFHVAVTPVGNPEGVPIPVDPVVAMVIGVNGELMQSVGLDEGGATVLAAVTWIVPDATAVPQPPVNGML